MQDHKPEEMVRDIIEACADCDTCRFLMVDTPCPVFPELYRLHDKEKEEKEPITPEELKNLVELCNFCGLCPCYPIRSKIMMAKHAFVSRDGLKPTIRLLEDVERVAKLCGAYPRLTIALFQSRRAGVLKKLAGIHEERKVPVFPKEDFPTWARRRGLHVPPKEKGGKVAFFAGCTGNYLFPEVPKAAVEVLQRNGIGVYFPEQRCCGMPSQLEGDQKLTFEFAAFNMQHLAEAVAAGYDIVCSCPTCGYMLKNVLSEGASYSAEHRAAVVSGEGESDSERTGSDLHRGLSRKLGNPIMEGLYQDDGYFAPMSALKRAKISRHTYDLGEYLRNLHGVGKLDTRFGPVSARMAYYPPCHLREQMMGEPYADLLSLVPGITMERIDGAFYCCGISGIMGFKRDFHEVSVEMGSSLMEKIKEIDPERLVSDCLSCRLQFNQLLPYKVFHPIEILNESYGNIGD